MATIAIRYSALNDSRGQTMAQATSSHDRDAPQCSGHSIAMAVFSRGPGATLPAADHGFSVRVRGGQCRGAEPFTLSLLNWMKRLIAARRSRRTFGRGSLRFGISALWRLVC
jgi:hypothetical protein